MSNAAKRLPEGGDGPLRVQADKIQPASTHQAQVRPPVRGFIQKRNIAGDIDGVTGKRIDRCRTNLDAGRVSRDFQQRQPGGLIEHVIIDAHTSKAVVFNDLRQRPISRNRLIRLKGNTD